MNQAKSILGGTLKATGEKDKDNGNPGPDAYKLPQTHSIPGFNIMLDTNANKKEEDKNKEAVGPQRYTPFNPNHKKSDHLRHTNNAHGNLQGGATSIGNAKRGELVQAVNVPGPGKYVITGDFEKALEKP